jgi:hypothetical protein
MVNDGDLIKVIEGFKFVIINTNFLFHPLLIYLLVFIMINLKFSITLIIYYDKSKSFNLYQHVKL